MNGRITLDRKILDWEWWSDPVTAHLFVHMLMKANWKDTKWRGQEIKKGAFVTSFGKLALESGLTVRQVRTAIEKLERTHEISRQATNRYSVITIEKYGVYQGFGGESDKPDGNQKAIKRQSSDKQMTNKRQTDDKQMTTDEERKEREEGEEREEREESKKREVRHKYGEYSHVLLKDSEKSKLEDEYGQAETQAAIKFLDEYMERSGKKYKNCYLAMRKWVFSALQEERNKNRSDWERKWEF